MNNKLIIFLTLISFIFGFAVYEAKMLDSKLSSSQTNSTGTILKVLPQNVIFKDFKTGKNVDLSMLTGGGSKLFIHFWATWCGPCEVEFPELVDMIHLFKDKKNVKFLLVAVNDDAKKVTKFLRKFSLDNDNILILTDDENQFQRFGTYKLPESFVFNNDNKIVKKFSGQQPWTQKYLVDFFKLL
jgi:thiol-disulfide isomerase/thioredoxin